MKRYTITKKIAKHGKQAVVVIPTVLQDQLKPGTVVQLDFKIVREAEEE